MLRRRPPLCSRPSAGGFDALVRRAVAVVVARLAATASPAGRRHASSASSDGDGAVAMPGTKSRGDEEGRFGAGGGRAGRVGGVRWWLDETSRIVRVRLLPWAPPLLLGCGCGALLFVALPPAASLAVALLYPPFGACLLPAVATFLWWARRHPELTACMAGVDASMPPALLLIEAAARRRERRGT